MRGGDIRQAAGAGSRAGGPGDPDDRPSSPGAVAARPLGADAYGLNLDPLATCLSCTSAQAGHNSSGAEGREFRLAGENVSEGQVPANGYASGALVTAPSNPLLGMAVAGWDGSTTANGSVSQAHARGSLIDLGLAGGRMATVTVGESTSDATYTESASHAHSHSDGARGDAGDGRLTFVLLHSEGASDAPGHAYLVSVDGEQVMQPDLASNGRRITVPRVTSVSLLHSDGDGGLVASASDGRAQRFVAVGTTWVGSPSADPQPLR